MPLGCPARCLPSWSSPPCRRQSTSTRARSARRRAATAHSEHRAVEPYPRTEHHGARIGGDRDASTRHGHARTRTWVGSGHRSSGPRLPGPRPVAGRCTVACGASAPETDPRLADGALARNRKPEAERAGRGRGRNSNSEDTAPNECRKELHRILDHKLHKSTPVRDGPTEVTVRESNTHGTIVGARSHFRAHGVPGGTASRRSHSSLSTSIAMAARLR